MLSTPPASLACVDEAADDDVGVGFVAEDPGDVGVAEHAGEAVAADEEAVAGPGVELYLVHVDRHVDADGADEDVPVGVVLGLGGGELAFFDHALDEGVVIGDLVEIAVAQEVRARVTDVGEAHAVALDEGGGEGGTHARDRAIEHRALEHGAVRLLDELREGALAPREVVLHRLEGEPRGDLAAAMASHAVRDGEERIHHEVRVLVALADVADVGPGDDDGPHPFLLIG